VQAFTSTYMYWTCKWTNIEQTELKFCLHLPPFPFQECTLVAPSLSLPCSCVPGNGSPRNSIALYLLDLCLNSVAYLKCKCSCIPSNPDTFKLVSSTWMNTIVNELPNLTLSWIVACPAQNETPYSGPSWWNAKNLSSIVDFNSYENTKYKCSVSSM